jgi:hypothetical protein
MFARGSSILCILMAIHHFPMMNSGHLKVCYSMAMTTSI